MMKRIVSVLFLGLLSAGVLSARGQDMTENSTVLYYHNLLFEGTSLTGRPPWVVGIKQEGGQFLEHPNRWVIESGQPEGTGELVVKLDREELESDVAGEPDHGGYVANDLREEGAEVCFPPHVHRVVVPLGRLVLGRRGGESRGACSLKEYGGAVARDGG